MGEVARAPRLDATSADIAVLLPVFNDDGRLDDTLRSLEAQQVPFVAVIVDDGSDRPVAVDPSRHGFEIVLLRHETNRGIERALNTGLTYIRRRRFAYVARLDNGDRCVPHRLAKQRAVLEADATIHLVGSAVEWRDDSDRVRFVRSFPTRHADIVRALRYTAALIHPAVMFRTSVVDSVGWYSTGYPAAEDYEYFRRIARRHRVANLPDTLLITRYDPRGLSMTRRGRQLRSTLRVQLSYFEPAVWGSYAGLLRTLGRCLIPYGWLAAWKAIATRDALPVIP